jgi:hypothetical protein
VRPRCNLRLRIPDLAESMIDLVQLLNDGLKGLDDLNRVGVVHNKQTSTSEMWGIEKMLRRLEGFSTNTYSRWQLAISNWQKMS